MYSYDSTLRSIEDFDYWRVYSDFYFKPVISIFDNTAAIPAGPVTGDRYIALVTANGWTKDSIYEYDGVQWIATTPITGCTVLIKTLYDTFVYLNASWTAIESAWLDPVISIFDNTIALPVAPANGDRYIAQVTANGWTANNIYEWNISNWIATLPLTGMMVYNNGISAPYLYTGAAWVVFNPLTAHDLAGALHNADTITNLNTKLSDGDVISTKGSEVSALTAKTVPLPADLLMIESVADTNAKRKSTVAEVLANETDPVFLARAVATNHYTGFPNRVDSTLSFTDGTLKFAIAGAFDVYGNGAKYTPAGAAQLEKVIADVTGLYWIWYTFPGGVPTLNASVSPPGFGVCLVATVYWNSTTQKGSLNDERHWMGRDKWWHEYTHETIGCRYASGLAGSFTDTTFSIALGEVYDEDIEVAITPAKTTCDVFYKNGSTSWVWDAANVTPYKLNGTSMRYNNVNALADVPNTNFVAMWVFATNKISQPIMVVTGQRVDVNIANARANNTPESLVLGSLPSAEMKLLYRVIFRQNAASVTYQETADYRTASALPITNFTPTQHSSLSNLNYTVANHTGFFTKAAGEIAAETLKAVPATTDMLLIEDSAAANVKKYVTVGAMKQFDTQRFMFPAQVYGANSDYAQLFSSVTLTKKTYYTQNFRHNQYDYCYFFMPVGNIKWDQSVINVRIYYFGIVAPAPDNKVYWGAKAFHVPYNELNDFSDAVEGYTYVQATYATANTMSRCLWTGLNVNVVSGAASNEGTIIVKITRNYFDPLDTYPNSVYSPYGEVTMFYTGV
jgi:hypothetical protein